MERRRPFSAKVRVRLAPAIVAVAFLIASVAFGAPAASASASAVPAGDPSYLKADVNELLKSVTSSELIGTSWWQGAVAMSTLEAYRLRRRHRLVGAGLAAVLRHHARL